MPDYKIVPVNEAFTEEIVGVHHHPAAPEPAPLPKTLAEKQYAAKRRAKKKISDASKRRNRK